MLLEALKELNMDYTSFTMSLKKEYSYLFVLVHYENKNIIDYTSKFGTDKYKKIVHVLTRDKETQKEVFGKDELFNNKVNFVIPEEYEDFSLLDNYNNVEKLNLPLKVEGLVVKYLNPEDNKTYILKFETNSYQMMSVLQPNTTNIYKSFVELYQNDMLKKHLEYFPGNAKIKNPAYEETPYDTIGIVDATFKVLTSELFELFKMLWDIKDCSHKNKDLYKLLPHEYTTVLYKIRGIYYSKK